MSWTYKIFYFYSLLFSIMHYSFLTSNKSLSFYLTETLVSSYRAALNSRSEMINCSFNFNTSNSFSLTIVESFSFSKFFNIKEFSVFLRSSNFYRLD